MEISVNNKRLLRQLKNFFSNDSAWVGELVQNAQRAHAERLNIDYCASKKILTFEDDGIGCSDPEKFFTLADSGWDEKTQLEQNSQGIGFFSLCGPASSCEVQSCNWTATVDFDHIDQDNALQISKDSPFVKGTKLVIQLKMETSGYDLYDYFEEFVRYAPFKEVLYGGRTLPTGESFISEDEVNGIGVAIDTEDWEGVVSLKKNYSCSCLHIFFQNRPLVSLSSIPLNGNLHMKTPVLNVRMPDRQAFVDDENYRSWVSLLNALAAKLAEKVLKSENQLEIKDRDYIIANLLSIETMKKLTKFVSLKEFKEGATSPATHQLDTFSEISLDKEAIKAMALKRLSSMADRQIYSRVRMTPSLSQKPFSEIKGTKTWIAATDIASNVDLLEKLEEFGYSVLVVRNEIEKKILKHEGVLEASSIVFNQTYAMRSDDQSNDQLIDKVIEITTIPFDVRKLSLEESDGRITYKKQVTLMAVYYDHRIVVQSEFFRMCAKKAAGNAFYLSILLAPTLAHELAHHAEIQHGLAHSKQTESWTDTILSHIVGKMVPVVALDGDFACFPKESF